jgi:hypothetical protein
MARTVLTTVAESVFIWRPISRALNTAFACEAAFGVPVAQLFAGLRESVGDKTIERMQRLKARLKTTGNTMNPPADLRGSCNGWGNGSPIGLSPTSLQHEKI